MNEISNKIFIKPNEFLLNKINKSSYLVKEILLKAIKGIEVSESEGEAGGEDSP